MKLFFLLLIGFASITGKGQNNQANYPDVTAEFNSILAKTKSRFADLNRKWALTTEMFARDINKLSAINKPLDVALTIYYRDLDTWRQIKTRYDFLYGYFRTGSAGDIKNGVLSRYGSNSKVRYNGAIYTVSDLGNINYGAALRSFGMGLLTTTCLAGMYQVYMDLYVKPTTQKYKEFIRAL